MRTLALSLALALAACGPMQKPEEDESTPSGPSDPLALKLQIAAVVEAAKAGDAAKVLEGLEPYLLPREAMVDLFGPQAGPRAWAGYSDTIAAKLRADAPQAIVTQVRDRGLTEVTVEQVGPAYPERTTPGDQQMLDALVQKQPMYTVRLAKPGETIGLRLNGFIFYQGKWRALLKSYDFLAPPPDAAPPPADAAPADAATDAGAPQ